MKVRDIIKIIAEKRDITFFDDGQANHYFLLMACCGCTSEEAIKLAYN
jgi:hypothetical protein